MIFKLPKTMKKIISFFAIAGALLAFASCQKEADIYHIDGGKTLLIINASQADATKTTLSGTTASWKEGDKVTVMYKKTSEDTWSTATSAGLAADAATASFTATLTSPDDSKSAYAIYPANNLSQTEADKAKITIAAVQHPTGTSFDGDSDIMISKPIGTSGTVSTQFARLGAVLKISIENATLTGEKLQRISVTADDNLVGDVLVGLSDAEVKGVENGNHTVRAEYAAGDQFTIGSSNYVYLIVMPQTLSASSTLAISGVTENYSFSKTITLENAIHLSAGHIIPMNIAISDILQMPTNQTGWFRVEDPSWLKVGDKVFIANEDGNYAMSTEQKSSNRGAVSIEMSNFGKYKKIESPSSEVQLFVLENGTADNSFAFMCYNGEQSGNYVYAASNENNHLKSKYQATSVTDANASFIANLSDGIGLLTAQGSNTHNVMQYNYNSGNPLFNCYSSASQKDISIFKYYSSISTTVCIEGYATSNSWVNGTAYSSVTIDSNVSVTGAGGGNNKKYYTADKTWRFYENNSGSFTISASSGTIKAIIILYKNDNNGVLVYSENSVPSGTEVSINSGSATFTVSHSSGDTAGAVRITRIIVEYQDS